MPSTKKRCYIGLSSTYHDPALAIVNAEGEVVFAEAAERYLQNKRAITYAPDDFIRFPKLIKKYCGDSELVIALTWPQSLGHRMGQIHKLLKFMSPILPDSTLITSNDGLAWPMGSVLAGLGLMSNSMVNAGNNIKASPYLENSISTKSYDHHLTHAATACLTSPFDSAACAIVDGFGGKSATSFFRYEKGKISPVGIPGKWTDGSLGQFYAVVCKLCNFDPITGEEWKVMGLAPYGNLDSDILQKFRELLTVDDLRLIIKLKNKAYWKWLEEMKRKAADLCRSKEGQANLAFTGQRFFSDIMAALLNNFYEKGISDNLVLAGGCALNSTYNGHIIGTTPFKRLHVPSAPGDDGCALGAALLAYYEDHPGKIRLAKTETPYLGSEISASTLRYCTEFANPEKLRHVPGGVAKEAASILVKGGIIGWIQGKAEYGPRALGNRSILADPRSADMKDKINARVKFREAFRPFAPAILHEFGEEYFENYQETPYMERTLLFKEGVRHKVPAVVHENGSGRLQTVKRDWSPKYYDLIQAFFELTGVPVILNTSFNVMSKPIVHSVEDALGVFHTSGLDALVIDDYIFIK